MELESLKAQLAVRIEEDERTIEALRSELSEAEQATLSLRETLSSMTANARVHAGTTEELNAVVGSLKEELAFAKQQASQVRGFSR